MTSKPFLPGDVGGTYNLDAYNLYPICIATNCTNRVDCVNEYLPLCFQHAQALEQGEGVPVDVFPNDTYRAAIAVIFGIPIDSVGSSTVDIIRINEVRNPQGQYTVSASPTSIDGRRYDIPRQKIFSPANLPALKIPQLQTLMAAERSSAESRGPQPSLDIQGQLDQASGAQASSSTMGAVSPRIPSSISPRQVMRASTSPVFVPKFSAQSVNRQMALIQSRASVAAAESANRVAEVITQRIPNVDTEALANAAAQAATQAATAAVETVGRELITAVNRTAAAAEASSAATIELARRAGTQGGGVSDQQLMEAIQQAAQLAATRAAENLANMYAARVQIDPYTIQGFIEGAQRLSQAASQIGQSNAEVIANIERMHETQRENELQKQQALSNITQNQVAVFGRIEQLNKAVNLGNRLAQQTLDSVDVQTRTLSTDIQNLAAGIPTAQQIGREVGANINIPTAAQIAAAMPPPQPGAAGPSADAIGIAVANRMVQLNMRPPSATEIVNRMILEDMRPPSAQAIGQQVGNVLARMGVAGGGPPAPAPGGAPGGGRPPGRGPPGGGGGGAPGGGAPGGGAPGGGGGGGPVPMAGIIFANPNNPNPVQPPGGGAMDLEGGPMTQQFIQEFMSRLADMSEQQRRTYVNFMNTINKQITDIIRKKKPFDEEQRQTLYDQLLNQYGFIMGEGYIANVIDVVFAAQARYHEDWRAGGMGFIRTPAIGVNPYLYPINLPPKPAALPTRTPRNAVPGTNGAIIYDPMEVDFINGAGVYGNIKNPTIPPVTVEFDKKSLNDKYVCTQKYGNRMRSKRFKSMFQARLFAMSGGFYSDEVAKATQASYQRPQNRLRVIPNITR